MKAVDSDIVHILPPDVWAFYAVNKKYEKIGYPLSSFPFHDDRWRVDNRISDSTKNLLARWESSKYRAQVFENGGILMNPRPTQFEMIEAKQLVGAGPLRDARFMLDLSGVLLNEYNTRNEYQDSCFISTLHHAAAMSHSSAMSTALGQVPKMIMEAILSGGGLVAESAYVKIGIFAANVTLRKDERTSWTDAIRQVVAGQVVESIYSAGIGEILSKPAAIVTLDKLQSQYDQISDVRYTNAIRTTPGHSYPGLPFETFVTTMDVTLVVAYDPLLNMVSGVMTSQQCAANEGAYAFNFKFDPGKIEGAISGKIAPPDQVWDGQVLFTDLKTGEAIR